MLLFEYVILYHPVQTKEDMDKGVRRSSEILKGITHVIANDEKEVAMRAAREIPDSYLDKLQQVQIAIRPF